MERMKHYLSICNSGPSEKLARIALRNRDKLLARNCGIVDENLPKWEGFFKSYSELFDWQKPDGSCMGFPRYKGAKGVEQFCRSLVDESGILFLPSTIYSSELSDTPMDRFRLGYGRKRLDEGLAVLDDHMRKFHS